MRADCCVRFHSEDYLGWNWKSRASRNSDTGVLTPAPPLGGAWITFAWRGGLTGATIQRWICASDVTLFYSFQPTEASAVLPFVAFKLREPEGMAGNVPLHCFDNHGRQMLDPQSHDHKAFIICEISHSAHTAFTHGFASTPVHFTTHTHRLRQVTSQGFAGRS